jgi:multimeric flavodoxin WrbA
MARIVVVYYSGYGHTKRLAETIAESAEAEPIAIDAEGNLPIGAWDKINAADGIILGSPTYMGNISWQFKKFADQSSRLWMERAWQDKVFGGFTNSAGVNGDKQVALIALQTFALQHGGIWVSLGLPPSSLKASRRSDLNSTGAFGGLLGQTPGDARVDEMASGDIDTARYYGKRIAGITRKLHS